MQHNIKRAYQYCLDIATNHYENFPVASILLPRALRYPIAAIYAFAREADDYSDEGNLTQIARLTLLNQAWQKLQLIEQGKQDFGDDKIYQALAHAINNFNLPLKLFFNLLSAFKQDVVKQEYNNFAEVVTYCQHSANPIGRLLLHLTHNDSQANLAYADNICTALQLINFLQDIYLDAKYRGRCYLPQDEMLRFNFKFAQILAKQESYLARQLIHMQLHRAKQLMLAGRRLGSQINNLFGLEIRLIISGGETIIKALYNRDSIYSKPTIKYIHWIQMFIKSFSKAKFQ